MTTNLNTAIFQWIHSGAGTRPVMDGLAVFCSEGGPYIMAIMFAGFWFLVNRKNKTALLEATWTAMLGLLINQLIGLFYFHPRPYMVGLGTPLFPHGPETSFPSDHATLLFAAAFYLLIARRWFACGVPLLTVAILTAWGRVYSGIHFPFDMAGSLVVAIAATGMMLLFSEHLAIFHDALIQSFEHALEILTNQKRKKVE